MNYKQSVKKIQAGIEEKLAHQFGEKAETASDVQYYKAVALMVKEMLMEGRSEFLNRAQKSKKIYYLCMEFLMGRSLKNNLFNLGIEEDFRKALKNMGVNLDSIYEQEPDAGLGNGGLGRLAACFLDGLATDGYPAMGYSLRYEYGIFHQKLVDGWQTELPDLWLPGGKIWMTPQQDKAVEVHFDGYIEESWNNQYHMVNHKDYKKVIAVPYDMYVAGMDGKGVSVLRVWKAKSADFDMQLFNDGDYLRAMEQNALAEAITKVLYPGDNHEEGKSLRLTQQYFLVSATIQDIIRRHLFTYSSLDNLPELAAIHLNDTHPVLAVPEMMRIMLDECGYGWDAAWNIVTRTIAYTNHTVMAEALECWGIELFKRRLPRIYQIIEEINRRFCAQMHEKGIDGYQVGRMAPLNDGFVKMANLAVVASHSVNGVSQLHSNILKETVFKDFYQVMPQKFKNVTNGIAHRRWLNQSNPELAAFLTETIGDGYIHDANELSKFLAYKDDKVTLEKLETIKYHNKQRLAEYIKKSNNVAVNPNSIFDVQVKRMHEYKRQQLNLLYLIHQYHEIKAGHLPAVPLVSIFGAKAAPAYTIAKDIIHALLTLSKVIAADPEVSRWLQVVFVENYNVTAAEKLIPACDLSEQISLASKEASGTGNMKFMLNGALTLGTMDGANVEICQQVGEENIYIFGQTSDQVIHRYAAGDYCAAQWYEGDANIRRAIDFLTGPEMLAAGHAENLTRLHDELVHKDWFQTLPDFNAYVVRKGQALNDYACDPLGWRKKCLVNIAKAGFFSSDRTIGEYDRDIWHLGQ